MQQGGANCWVCPMITWGDKLILVSCLLEGLGELVGDLIVEANLFSFESCVGEDAVANGEGSYHFFCFLGCHWFSVDVIRVMIIEDIDVFMASKRGDRVPAWKVSGTEVLEFGHQFLVVF